LTGQQSLERNFRKELDRRIEGRDVSELTPRDLFSAADDDFWLWALTVGCRESAELEEMLPDLPSEDVQIKTNANAGDAALRDGFHVYRLVRQIYEIHSGDLASARAVLDFGCGWGRVIRFFLKDLEPDLLWGVDIWDGLIDICRQTNRWSNFKLSKPFPPIDFADGEFDLTFAYSVFSHLSEDAARQWVEELTRILRPGGLLIATTRGRDFIEQCAEAHGGEQHRFSEYLSVIFEDTASWLDRFDRGQFCFDSSAFYGEQQSWFGEASIPEDHVRKHWTGKLEVLDYIDDRGIDLQNVIVARRRA
jgi:SAM-dependent methyltransferase